MSLNSKPIKKYYDLNPIEIAEDINRMFNTPNPQIVRVKGEEFIIHPHVYPSHRFRSTNVMLDSILKFTKNRRVCEIGCGCGALGQIALKQGASYLVQGDINHFAVVNAKANQKFHKFTTDKLRIFESDCFDNIPEDKFDVIIFAMPYHNEQIEITDPLLKAFYDPNFNSIKKFLKQAPNFFHPDTQIFIAFSNKGNTELLESIFELSCFQWELFKIANTHENFDNRVYRLYKK